MYKQIERTKIQGWRMAVLLCGAISLSLAAGSLGGPAVISVHAAEDHGTAAANANAISRSDSSIFGGTIVWLNTSGDGEQQIYAQDESSGTIKVLTSRSSAKDVPSIYGTTVVWADKGNQPPASANWDIYSYDLATGVERKLNRKAGEYGNPSVDGNGVVWADNQKYGRMIYYDAATGAETSLGEGRYPVLNNGRVVYRNARDGGLSLLEIGSGVHRPLVTLGGSHYVDWFVTNGEYVLFKQKNGSLESKYGLISLQAPLATPQDLTPMRAKSEEYAFMSMGDSQAVFLVNEGGQPVLQGVNLATAKVYAVGQSGAGKQYIGFNGDRLLYAGADGSLGSVNLGEGSTGPITEPGTGGGTTPSPGSSSGNSMENYPNDHQTTLTENKFLVGPEGGKISIKDGRFHLDVLPGTFDKEMEIRVSEMKHAGYPLVDELGRRLEAAGAIWEIQTEATWNREAMLSLATDDGDWAELREKLGVYQYQAELGYWTYIGGITGGLADSHVQAQARIDAPGTYAVLLRKVSFEDVPASHWAAKQVEVLAARGIVNGREKERFAPKATLTRAEFSKMLAGALGIAPITTEQPTFRDVDSTKWSYGWVEAAAAAGIVEGNGGLFAPEAALTREQMMAMLVRAAQEKLGEEQARDDVMDRFADRDAISGWALPLTRQAVAWRLVEGSGDLIQPRATTTRAEAAVVIYRLLERIGEL